MIPGFAHPGVSWCGTPDNFSEIENFGGFMKKTLIGAMVALLAFACEREELLDSVSTVDTTVEKEYVYIFGKKATGLYDPHTLLCWKDGGPIAIDQVAAGRSPYLRKALSGNGAVYLVGTHADPSTGGNSGKMAMYWKNGVRKALTAAEGSYVYGASLASGTLYVYGSEGSSQCLWVDDVKYTFSFIPGYSSSVDVAVTSDSIYLVGMKGYPDSKLGYWKIPLPLGDSATPLVGAYVDLNGSDISSVANNAYAVNDILVIAGFRNFGGYYYPSVWIGDTPTTVGNSSTAVVSAMYVIGDAASPSYVLTQGVAAGASAVETVLARGGTVNPVPFPAGYNANQYWSAAAATADQYVIIGASQTAVGTPYIARYWLNDTSASTVLNDAGDTVNSCEVNAVTIGKGW